MIKPSTVLRLRHKNALLMAEIESARLLVIKRIERVEHDEYLAKLKDVERAINTITLTSKTPAEYMRRMRQRSGVEAPR